MSQSNFFEQVVGPHRQRGQNVVLLQGSRKNDIFPVEDTGTIRIQPGMVAFQNDARKDGYIYISYGFASGITADLSGYLKKDADHINNHLNHLGVLNTQTNSKPDEEFVAFTRGILTLIREGASIVLSDGKTYRFIIGFNFPEHLFPEDQKPSVLQKVSLELAHELINSLALRKSECLIILKEERECSVNQLLRNQVPVVRIPSANSEERRLLLRSLKIKYPNFKTILTDEELVAMSRNMLNRSVEKIFYASSKYGSEITPSLLSEENRNDILRQSEGTLSPVDMTRVVNRLAGRTIEPVLNILDKVADDLKMGRKTLRNVILAGAPSTGKTALATYVAQKSGMQAFTVNSVKNSLVGESERRLDVLLNLAREMGGIYIIDEIDSLFNFDRNQQNMDSGVSNALSAKFLSFFSDESLAGKAMFIGTTNRPDAISDAMRSRFSIIPVISPLREDMPEILGHVCKGLDPTFDMNKDELRNAAWRYFDAGASIREIRESLVASQLILGAGLSANVITHSASAVIPDTARESYIYADLMAVKNSKSASFLPFWDNSTNSPNLNFPYPSHLKEVLDDHLYIDQFKLNRKLKELKPYANV